MGKENERLEQLLREGLDRVSDLGDEQPPDLGNLQMLVATVQAEQRQRLRADLLKFWGVAAVLLTALLFGFMRSPTAFLFFQGAAGLLSLVGVGLWYASRKQVTE